MNSNRRDFLKGTLWMGAVAAASGCVSGGLGAPSSGYGQGFRVAPIKKVRVGVIGVGHRGRGAVHRLSAIPGVEVTALCDLYRERIGYEQKWLKDNGKPAAREYVGPEAYKDLCQSDLDLVYVVTGWDTHVMLAVHAMECGKHAAIEVPAARTLEECWRLVETAERTKRHCMQLENCCYGEIELLCKNLVETGVMGEIVHAECAYIHDLRECCYRAPKADQGPDDDFGYDNYWRLRHNVPHKGNQYETHGLGPVCMYMDVNRGDRLEYLCSLESNQHGFEKYGREHFPADSWQAKLKVEMGDMNTTLVKTHKGRSILIQHDVSSIRPYSRINLLQGTNGIVRGISRDYDLQIAFPDKPGGEVHKWFDEKKMNAFCDAHMHPLWKAAGAISKKVGGHGGMDFLMDLRMCYCLQNGLPLDTDVYDLATWCSIAECSERSVRERRYVDLPDFTRGGWKTAKPFGLFDIDLKKMGLEAGSVKADKNALNV